MKLAGLSMLAALAVLPAALAVDTSSLPTCAQTCFRTGISSSTTCSASNDVCMCQDMTLLYNIGTCLGSCDANAQVTALNFIETWCTEAFFSSLGLDPTSFLSLYTSLGFTAVPTGRTTFATTAGGRTVTTTATAHATGTAARAGSTSIAQEDSHGLSTGAKIGLGLGVPLLLALIAGLIIACICLKRRKKTTTIVQAPPAAQQSLAPTPMSSPPGNSAMPVGGIVHEKMDYNHLNNVPPQQHPMQPPPQPQYAPAPMGYMPPPQGYMQPPPQGYAPPPNVAEMAVPLNPPMGAAAGMAPVRHPSTTSTVMSPVSAMSGSPQPQHMQPGAPPLPQGQIYEAPVTYAHPQNGQGFISELPAR